MLNKTQQPPDFEYFVIYDSKVGVYREPMLSINRYDLLREFDTTFRDVERRQKSQYFLNAEDFALFKIGEYSKRTGVITPTPHEHIANLHELRTAVLRKDNATQPQSNGVRDAQQLGIVPT